MQHRSVTFQRALTGVLPFAGLPVLRFSALFVPLEPSHLGGFGDRNSNSCGDRTGSAECGLGKSLPVHPPSPACLPQIKMAMPIITTEAVETHDFIVINK